MSSPYAAPGIVSRFARRAARPAKFAHSDPGTGAPPVTGGTLRDAYAFVPNEVAENADWFGKSF
jgi:hypothetical protein